MFNNSAIVGLSSLGRIEIIKTFYSFNTENCIPVSNFNSEFRVFNCIHSKLQVSTSKYKYRCAETASILIPAGYYKSISLQNSNQRDGVFYKRYNCHFYYQPKKKTEFQIFRKNLHFQAALQSMRPTSLVHQAM